MDGRLLHRRKLLDRLFEGPGLADLPLLLPLPAAMLLAAMAVHRLPRLPDTPVCAGLALAGLLLLARSRGRWRAVGRLAGLFLLGAVWTILRADAALALRISPAQEGVDFVVHGYVSGMPQATERGQRFMFRVERCAGPSAAPGAALCPVDRDLRLSWYRSFVRPSAAAAGPPQRAAPLRPLPRSSDRPFPGERWQLTVRLKRPHALLNPNAFDAELRALSEGVAASGYVSAKPPAGWPNRRLDGHSLRFGPTLQALRSVLRDAILTALTGYREDAAGVVAALSIGDQAAIPAYWWEAFNRTSVAHLMSISGLHITMLAAMAAGAAGRLLRHPVVGRTGLLERWPASRLKWAFALVVAFAYSALAGWGIPAQRTCWMLAVAGLSLLGGRSRSLPRVLSLSAAVVTILDPWAPLSAGFWLSFASVAAIIWFGSQELRAPPRQTGTHQAIAAQRMRAILSDAVRTQWAATLALLPLGALFFSSFSLVGPLANAFAIPLVSIVITPLALLGTGLLLPWPALGGGLLGAVCVATGWLLDGLAPLSAPRYAIIVLPPPPWPATLAAAAAILALLAPLRLPGRPAAFAALLPLFAQLDARPPPGTLVVTALDVGQGSAILVEAPGGRLLFDTGPRYNEDSDAGARVLVPWLRSRGIGRLEAMVVSHADDDHAGGGLSVLAGVQVDRVASPLAADHPIVAGALRHEPCRRGLRWQWGEVDLEFLHPGPERTSRRSSTNAGSCVLRVTSPAGTVLLTGDIESAQERFLVEKLGSDRLRADVLIAAHHGSNGSSSMPFLRAVAPALAIAQVGYRNRFRHPGEKARIRYRLTGIPLLRTDRDGAITVTLREAGSSLQVGRLRHDDGRYWRIRTEP